MHLCYMLALYFYWICSFITFLRVLIANQTALVTYCSQRCSLISLPGCDTHEWTNGIGIYTGGASEKKNYRLCIIHARKIWKPYDIKVHDIPPLSCGYDSVCSLRKLQYF